MRELEPVDDELPIHCIAQELAELTVCLAPFVAARDKELADDFAFTGRAAAGAIARASRATRDDERISWLEVAAKAAVACVRLLKCFEEAGWRPRPELDVTAIVVSRLVSQIGKRNGLMLALAASPNGPVTDNQ